MTTIFSGLLPTYCQRWLIYYRKYRVRHRYWSESHAWCIHLFHFDFFSCTSWCFYDMKCYLWFSVWNIYVEWKQTQYKNTLKEWLMTKTLKYSVIFIWHARDIIDYKQENQGNSVPGLAIFNFFFSFPDDKSLCLSFSVQITCCELKYKKRYCLNEEFDWLYLPSIKIYWCHAENKLVNLSHNATSILLLMITSY